MKNVISFVCVYICTIIGASFITGNEIYHYFAKFGNHALYLLLLCAIVFLSTSIILFIKFKKANISNMLDVCNNKKGKKSFFNIVFTLLSYLTYFTFASLMISGLNELFGTIFCLITLAFSFVLLQFDLSGIVKVNVILFPLVILYLLGLLYVSIYHPNATQNIVEISTTNYLNIFPYVTLNVVLLCGSVLQLSNKMTTKQIILSCLLSCAILVLFIFVQIYILQHENITNIDMPLVDIAKNIPALYILTLVVTFLAMLSSFLSSAYALYSKIKKSTNSYFYLTILFALMFVCSLLGFSKIVEYSYIILGLMSCFIVLVIIVKKMR